jgi:biopolymer transport protein ExbB
MYQSALDLFVRGGPVMWPLLFASVTAVALILDRIIAFVRWHQSFDRVAQVLRPLITAGEWEQAEKWCARRGPLTRLAAIYMQQRDQPRDVREDLLKREGLVIIGHLDKGLRLLAMLAQVSTLLGLLATFHVMIVRFAQGQGSGAGIQPANFSSAIWESLLTTMYGLMIAIPCSAVYQVLEGRVDALARQMDIFVSALDEWRRHSDAREARSANPAPAVAMPAPAISAERA